MYDSVANFIKVSDTIFRMKESYHSTMAELIHSRAEILDTFRVVGKQLQDFKDRWEYTYNGVIRNYLNVFTYACCLYNEELITARLFEATFRDEIISIYENNFGINAGIDLHNPKGDEYEQLIKTYNKFKGEKK